MTRTADYRTVAGLPVRVWSGTADGPTVIGLPGLGGSSGAWSPLAAAIPSSTFVAPDLRGRGRAYQFTGPTGLRAHARDVNAIAEELDLRDVVIVGHSMGAYLAPIAAEELGDRVKRLVLVDGGVRPAFPFFMKAAVVRFVFKRQTKKFDRTFTDVDDLYRVSNDGMLSSRPDLVAPVKQMLADDLVGEPGALRAALDPARLVDDAVDSFFGPDVEPALAALRVPAVVLAATAGKSDKAGPFLSDAALEAWTSRQPLLTAQRVQGNHMTILFSSEVVTAICA